MISAFHIRLQILNLRSHVGSLASNWPASTLHNFRHSSLFLQKSDDDLGVSSATDIFVEINMPTNYIFSKNN